MGTWDYSGNDQAPGFMPEDQTGSCHPNAGISKVRKISRDFKILIECFYMLMTF